MRFLGKFTRYSEKLKVVSPRPVLLLACLSIFLHCASGIYDHILHELKFSEENFNSEKIKGHRASMATSFVDKFDN